jgi:hypothetical protein
MVSRALEVDHLVIAARTLDEGAAWCEATFGVVPGAGGRHAFMGTHNRLLALGGGWPLAYLEIIAIDPDAPAPGRPRWFGLDAFDGAPRLVHWVARCAAGDLGNARDAALAAGHDPGRVHDAARGALRWRITVPDDGALAFGGAAPTLIEWLTPHPALSMPPGGIELLDVEATGLPAALPLPARVRRSPGAPGLRATLRSASATVTL